jgi:hypothetical protein
MVVFQTLNSVLSSTPDNPHVTLLMVWSGSPIKTQDGLLRPDVGTSKRRSININNYHLLPNELRFVDRRCRIDRHDEVSYWYILQLSYTMADHVELPPHQLNHQKFYF